jgi:hypothetical protein
MKSNAVNRKLLEQDMSVTGLAGRISARLRRPCTKSMVSLVASGVRRTSWLQNAIAKELDVNVTVLFGGGEMNARRAAR